MSLTWRFSRLADGTPRLRVTATGATIEHLAQCTPIPARHRPAGGDWQALLTFTGADACLEAAATLTSSVDPELANAGERIRPALDRLDAAYSSRQRAGQDTDRPVLDDAALRSAVRARAAATAPSGALVVDELGLGAVRADVAVLTTGQWAGIELKGATDTLTRLPRQVAGYSAVFDHCELVTTAEHAEHAAALLPDWWQLTVVTRAPGDNPAVPRLDVIRSGSVNPTPDGYARAQLLWRGEALAELTALGADRGLRSARRSELWQALAGRLDAGQMRAAVTCRLAGRVGWLTDDGRSRSSRGT